MRSFHTQPHPRLDAYRVSLELFTGVERLASALPRGHADLKDQLRRAAAAVVRHIAEGCEPATSARQGGAVRGRAVRGAECDAALEMAGIVGIADRDAIRALRWRAGRISAMPRGLMLREQGRAVPRR